MKYFSILLSMKNGVKFEYVPWKNVWFCFISIIWVDFSHKTKKFLFWKSFKYFNIFWWKKYMASELNMPFEKMSDFVSFPLFGFILVLKPKTFDSESHWNTFFYKKNDVRFRYALPNSSWFGLSIAVWVEVWQ